MTKDKQIKKVIFFFNFKSKLSLFTVYKLNGMNIDRAINVKPPYLKAG